MYRKCCVPRCESKRQDVKLHRMPVNIEKKNMWVKAITAGAGASSSALECQTSEDLEKLHVCHKHFESKYVTDNLRLLNNACPTLFTNEEMARGIPSESYAEIETSHIKHDHSYSAKLHCDHTYAKAQPGSVNATVKETSHIKHDHSYSAKLHCDHTYAKAQPDSVNATDKDILVSAPVHEHEDPVMNELVADKEESRIDSTDLLESTLVLEDGNPAVIDADEKQSRIESTGRTTPPAIPAKKLHRKKQILSYNALSPNCKVLYKEFKRARRQLNYKRRVIMATKFSKRQSFEKLTENMNEVCKKMLWMQVKLCTKTKKGRRFTTEEKIIALAIMKQSPKCYRFLQRIFILPSKTTLNKLTASLHMEAGVNAHVFNALKEEVSTWSDHKKFCTIVFDEMSLTPGLTYNKSSDNINGFVELKTKSNRFADHALVFLLRGAVHKWKQPIAFYFSEGAASAQQVRAIIRDIVEAVSATGLVPIALVSDQGSSFQSAYKSLQEETRRNQIIEGRDTDDTIELCGHRLSVIYDPPHLLKGVRNNFLTKDVMLDGKKSTWSDIVDVYTTDCRHAEMRLLHKLNDEHVIPKKINKMKVRNCARVFSKTMAAALSYTAAFYLFTIMFKNQAHYADGTPVSETLKNTAELVSFLDDLFDSVNGATLAHKSSKGKVLRKAVTAQSPHQSFWQTAIKKIENIKFVDEAGRMKSVPSLKNWITTLKSYERLWQYLKTKNVKVMRPRYFNSDTVENFFGQVRAYNYRSNEPTCQAFMQTFKSLMVTGFIKFHENSFNCEDDSTNQVIKIKSLFENQPKTACLMEKENKSEPGVSKNIEENIQIQAARERLSVHSRAYTAGWVVRKVLERYNCSECKSNFTSQEPINVHKWISQREYKTIKQNKLTYPSVYAVRQFGNIVKESNEYLERNSHMSNIINKIKKRILDKKYTFDFVRCKNHRGPATEYFLAISIRLCVHNWCNTINKILKGTDVLRLEGRQLPFLQTQAFNKYKKKLKNKKMFK